MPEPAEDVGLILRMPYTTKSKNVVDEDVPNQYNEAPIKFSVGTTVLEIKEHIYKVE